MIYYLAILRAAAAISIKESLEYRVNWLFGILSTLISTAVTIFVLSMMFQWAENLSGWSLEEILVFIGVYKIVTGAAEATFIPGLSLLPDLVRTGSFNRFVIMPCSTLYFLSIYRMSLLPLTEVFLGIGLVLIGISSLPNIYWIPELFLGTLTITCGIALLYVFWVSCMSLSFWLVEISNLQLLISIFTKYGQYPTDIYPRSFGIIFQSIFPIGVAISVPAEALTGHDNWQGILWSLLLLSIFAGISLKLWRCGLKNYTGVGI